MTDGRDPRLSDSDPRITDEYVRVLRGGRANSEVVLVGVVHDHPASTFRVSSIVEDVQPSVLALELPPFAVPLFERYADDGRTPPPFGGEMSAAIQAAATDEVAGIDGPTVAFLVQLLRNLHSGDASPGTTGRVLRGLASVTKHAAVCRLAAVLAARTGLRVEVDAPVAHACGWEDDPRVQAEDERSQIRQARAVASAFPTPDAIRFRKATREEHMADRLSELRRSGDVVAVVGLDHLEPLAERLRKSDGERMMEAEA